MTRVVIIASSAFRRDAIHRILALSELEVTRATTDIDQAAVLVSRHKPDLVVIDLEAPADVPAVLDAVLDVHASTRPLVLADARDHRSVLTTLTRGARGFLLRDQPSAEMLRACREVVAGGVVIDPRVAAGIVSVATQGCRVRGPYGLSRQELMVLRQLRPGWTNDEIGERIGISNYTVKSHLRSAFRKLQVRTRAEAARFAAEHGLA